MSVQMNIKWQAVNNPVWMVLPLIHSIQYTVALDGEESDLYPKEFDVPYLWMKYSD